MANFTYQIYYKHLHNYATIMVAKNLSQYTNNMLNADDFVATAFTEQCSNYDDAIKIIRNAVITEKRRLIGDLQRNGKLKNKHTDKVCKSCKQSLPLDLYYSVTDYRIGFMYYTSKCKTCILHTKNTQKNNAQRRLKYANDYRAKQLARLRYLKFKKKKKTQKD
jgi:hypothetical protein